MNVARQVRDSANRRANRPRMAIYNITAAFIRLAYISLKRVTISIAARAMYVSE